MAGPEQAACTGISGQAQAMEAIETGHSDGVNRWSHLILGSVQEKV